MTDDKDADPWQEVINGHKTKGAWRMGMPVAVMIVALSSLFWNYLANGIEIDDVQAESHVVLRISKEGATTEFDLTDPIAAESHGQALDRRLVNTATFAAALAAFSAVLMRPMMVVGLEHRRKAERIEQALEIQSQLEHITPAELEKFCLDNL